MENSDNIEQQQHKEQQHSDPLQQQKDNVHQHTDPMQQHGLDTMQQHTDTVQQQLDTINLCSDDMHSVQYSMPSMHRSDSVDSEEKKRQEFVAKVVMEVIKRCALKDINNEELDSFTKCLVKEILKGLKEDFVPHMCSKNVSKAVYSKLRSKFGKRLKYMPLVPDPGALASLVKCFQSQMLEKKANYCICSRKCILTVITDVTGLASVAGPFIILFIAALLL